MYATEVCTLDKRDAVDPYKLEDVHRMITQNPEYRSAKLRSWSTYKLWAMGRSFKLHIWNQNNGKTNINKAPTQSLSEFIGATKGSLSSACRRAFLRVCWDHNPNDSEWAKSESRFDSYFSSYEEFCQVDRPHVLTQCPHDELCRAARQLITGTREEVEDKLSKILPNAFNVPGDVKSVVAFIGKAILRIDLADWRNDETLREHIKRTLGTMSKQSDHYRLPSTFNAATFSQKAGIQILWQTDIVSHLNIAFGETTLKMFHDVALLDLLESGPFRDVLPSSFVEETRRTIDLMLPRSEPRCRHWLERQLRDTNIGVSVMESAFDGIVDRNLQTFDFWRDRLIVAKDVFDTCQPNGLKQLILDDRNRVQYWTFWIAFIVFWLTLGGFVTGCLQTYKAFHPSPQPPWLGPEN